MAEYVKRCVEGEDDLFLPEVKQIEVCRQPFCQLFGSGVVETFACQFLDLYQVTGCKGVEYQ